MLDLVRSKLGELQAACIAHSVQRLDLFGSAANGAFDESRSDLDFLVEFAPCSPSEHYERYFGLHESLAALFGREIDIVEPSALRNPYFVRSVADTAVSLYAA